MKRYLILTIVSLFAAFTFSVPATVLQQTTSQQSESPRWIEVGTVVGECYDHNAVGWYLKGPKELKLYVMYLGEKLIYRVEWNGNFYPVVYNDNSSHNAYARIPGWVFKYKTNSDGTSDRITDEAKVVFSVPSW